MQGARVGINPVSEVVARRQLFLQGAGFVSIFYLLNIFCVDRPVETVENKVDCLWDGTCSSKQPVENLWKSGCCRSPAHFCAKILLGDRVQFSTNKG
ncbi:hypothetical protein [Tychonema sp. LEGE 07203]|uniref:hypothetical protein n=1 Tax=Tychonema sp. LEGE 07203 TaxID=1828671 RepID=UPI001882CC32|nr:hypothetical protein [Tychonema sp. LEGE 07203]